MYKQSIGIIGGFGAYATLAFYQSILEQFASDSERNYPHIYMDNDFTMPSRTRALLYDRGGVSYNEIVCMIADSMKKMEMLGADHIVLVCGTAHAFLPDVYRIVPEVKTKVCNIIEILRDNLIAEGISKVLVIAAEGALKQGLYSEYLQGLDCVNPGEEYYEEIRYFIESVKKNVLNENIFQRFIDFLHEFECKEIILGCTEFPVLIDAIRKSSFSGEINRFHFWNPLFLTIKKLKKIME